MNPVTPILDKVVQSELMTSDGWRYRRALVFGIEAFLCVLIGAVVMIPAPAGIAPAVLAYAFPALLAIFFAYVFGAYYDDKDKRARAERLGGSQAASGDDSAPDTPKPSKAPH